LKKKKKSVQAWLEQQDAYTMHRPARKRYPPNPYTVTNVWDVFECDLPDLRAYARYNDNHRYIPTVIDAFSKYLHLVPVKTKSGPSINSVFSPYSPTRNSDPYGCGQIRARNS
jgi:hypothetical protein